MRSPTRSPAGGAAASPPHGQTAATLAVMDPGAPTTARVTLRDGRVALVAPLHPDDRSRYLAGVRRISPDSLYKRFLTPVERLSESQLRYLLEVDHRDHEALLAVDEATGDAVGVARFARLVDRPDAAEAAVVVVDDWQGFGLGKALCRLLAQRAREVGVRCFEAYLLAANKPMLALLETLGPVRVLSEEAGTLAVEVSLPDEGIGEHMTGVLRAAAAGDFELVTPAEEPETPR
jgi:RimJ/RimL family protein N-acetyltransferase